MCHTTAKRESVAVSTVSAPFLPASIHRKRITFTLAAPPLNPANSNNNFGAAVPVSINIVPPAGYSVLLQGVTINCTAAYSGQATIKDGATTKAVYDFSEGVATPDVSLPISASGLLGSGGNTMNIALPNTPAASVTNVNVTAQFVPTQIPRVSISPDNPAVLDAGLTIEGINDVVVLTEHEMSDWINRNLFIVANVALQVSIVDHQERSPAQGAHYEHADHFLGNKETKGSF